MMTAGTIVSVDMKPRNVNLASVSLNVHESAKQAPIRLDAGCSWADLDVDCAEMIVQSLQAAIKTVRERGDS